MIAMSVFAFAILIGYLVYSAIIFGVPTMVSDTFYQHGKRGWIFTIVMMATSLIMFPCMADLNENIAPLAFLGCGSLCYVGYSPHYIREDERIIHKVSAIASAVFCVSWCIAISPFPTAILSLVGLILSAVWKSRYLYICEVFCFLDVFITYWYAL